MFERKMKSLWWVNYKYISGFIFLLMFSLIARQQLLAFSSLICHRLDYPDEPEGLPEVELPEVELPEVELPEVQLPEVLDIPDLPDDLKAPDILD